MPATRAAVQPVSRGAAENPKPGTDGTTTWKSAVSGSIIAANSTKEFGQPCVRIRGSASGFALRTCRKCTS
jgi:hypothetical protein